MTEIRKFKGAARGAAAAFIVALAVNLAGVGDAHSQGYIVPNGVVYAGNLGLGDEVDVIYNPINMFYTGFF